MWSLGVTTFSLLFGYPPFYGETDKLMRSAIQSGEYTIRDRSIGSEQARAFIAECLQVLPGKRLTAAAALEHTWLAQEDAEAPVLSPEMVREMQAYAAASQTILC